MAFLSSVYHLAPSQFWSVKGTLVIGAARTVPC